METWDKRLQECLDRKGWSAAELQRRSGLPYESIKKWQKGEVDNPRGEAIAVLAKALGVDEIWLRTGRQIDSVEQRQDESELVSWIKARLLESGKTQADLARHLRLPESRVSEIVNCKRGMSPHELASTLEFFGHNVPWKADVSMRNAARSAKAIAGRLSLTRRALGLSKEDFASRADIKPGTYCQLEDGSKLLSRDSAQDIKDAFGLTLDWLFDGDLSGLRHALALEIDALKQR